MSTRVEQVLGILQTSVDLVEKAKTHAQAALPSFVTAFLQEIESEPLLKIELIDHLKQGLAEIAKVEERWVPVRDELVKLLGELGRMMQAREWAHLHPAVGLPPGIEVNGKNLPFPVDPLNHALVGVRHLLTEQHVWLGCPGWITERAFTNHLEALANAWRHANGIPFPALPYSQEVVDGAQKFLRGFRPRVVSSVWAAWIDLAANGVGYAPRPGDKVLEDALCFRGAFIRDHGHDQIQGDPSSLLNGQEGRATRLALRVQQVASCLRLGLLKGAHPRSVLIRYKVRSELYRAKELLSLADGGEDALNNDVAKYLFDAGYLPIREAQEGAYRPDVMDLAGAEELILEIKASDKPADVRMGFLQAYRYARRRNLARSYYLIFILKGAEWDVPAVVDVQGVEVVTVQVMISGDPARGPRPARREVWASIKEDLQIS